MSVLSLGLLLPFGAGAFPDRALAILQDAAAEAPSKTVVFLHGASRDTVQTHATSVDAFLAERGIARRPEDQVSTSPAAELREGSAIAYRPAVDVSLILDGESRQIRTPAATVGELLAAQQVGIGQRDRLTPAASTTLKPGSVINLTRVTSWLERVRTRIAPPVTHKYDIAMAPGTQRIVDPGAAGTKETTVAVLQPNGAAPPKRMFLAARVLRLPRARVVADGVGDAVAVSQIVRRGFVGTIRLADAALSMVATAYTAGCFGCSGLTASGRPAGQGVVAVDPRVIPLGTHLFIPGYGRALAGDTGGAIRGNRIDLGFESNRAARNFGRRAIVVYVLK